jgi:OmcA/MtrC family decaheme c-type cytochrome
VCHDEGSVGDIGVVHPGLALGQNLDLEIIEVSNDNGAAAVTFTVFDADTGLAIQNMTMDPIRIMFNQYEPAANAYDPSIWSEDHLYERGSTAGANSRLVQSSPGTYTYTFLETIADAVANDGMDTSLTQQVSMRIRGFFAYNAVNDIYQITGMPTTSGAVAVEEATAVGEIVTTDACESCHGPRIGNVGHGGGYNKVEYCRNCHTPDNPTRVTNGTDLVTMIHQIHAAIDHTNGGNDPGEDWTHVTYPQDVNNCAKCHKGLDGDNWNLLPNRAACGSCHYDVNFDTGLNHVGGIQPTNANCANCHTEPNIRLVHRSENATPNNPDVPPGYNVITYEINSVTVDSMGIATVNFAILENGTPFSGLDTTFPPTGYTGSPNFRLAYALPQDGINNPADWNNLGETKAQPLSIGLDDVVTANDLTDAGGGTYDAVLTAVPFPANATMRAVAIDGYFTQTSVSAARHAPSAVMAVDGDDERRAIVDFNGCLACHERLELHGGNRVIAAETPLDSVAVCIACHNPNLSSSGNTFDYADYMVNPGNYNSSSDDTVATYGTDPFTWPEATQNFKDLVHGIHGSAVRENAYEHVRIRGGNAYSYDWSHVTYPNDASNCAKCHVDESYRPENVPDEALMSTDITGMPTNLTEALAVRDTVPNADDTVIAARTAACYACHNGDLVQSHMNQMGAGIGLTRDEILNP